MRQTKAAKYSLWFILILTLGFCAAVTRSRAADEIIIWIDPPTKTVGVGETFNVTIQIDNLPSPDGAVGFQIGLVWDPNILTGISMADVIFHAVTPESDWSNIWAIANTINNTAGSVLYAYTFQDMFAATEAGYAPVSGNHTLAVVTLRGARSGNSPFSFVIVKIGDQYHPDAPMPYRAINGTVRVGNPPPDITVDSPQNATYTAGSVSLAFALSKSTSWIGYSLDGHTNVTVTGNTTIQTADGRHTLVVYANDTIGQMGSSEKIYFAVDTTPPTVSFTFSPQPLEAEYFHGNFRWTLNFSAADSQDATSGIAAYYWDFGDGTNGTGATAAHLYRQSGSYNVNLTVTDDAGYSATQVQTITIDPGSAPLNFSFGLLASIVIPAVWIPALGYYFIRTRRIKKKVKPV